MHYYNNLYPSHPYFPPAQNINPYQAWNRPYFQRPPMLPNPYQSFDPAPPFIPPTYDRVPYRQVNRVPDPQRPPYAARHDLSSPLDLGTPGLELDKSSEEDEGNVLYGSDGEATDLVARDLGIGLSREEDQSGFVGGYLGLHEVNPYGEFFVTSI